MSTFTFNNVRIAGISCTVPKKKLSIRDCTDLYNGNSNKLQRVIESSGFLYRRVVGESVTSSDLCLQAAEDLLKSLKVNKDDIDALLFVSYTPDYVMPATSYVLHGKMGLSKKCVVMDIPQACSGYVLGLLQASMLLNAGCKKVLLLVGDTFSKFNDMFQNTAPIFGDAGSATLLEYDTTSPPTYFNVYSDGSQHDALMCHNGGFRSAPTQNMFYSNGDFAYNSHMNGGKIFNFAIQNIASSIQELLEFSTLKSNDIDWFVFHQANKFIIENISRQLEIDIAKAPIKTLTEYGNQCGASIPCCIADSLQNQVTSMSNTLLLAGFGVGLSWANAIVNIENIYCSKICEYLGDEDE